MTPAVEVSSRSGSVRSDWPEIDRRAEAIARRLPASAPVMVHGRTSLGLIATIVASWRAGCPVYIAPVREDRSGSVAPTPESEHIARLLGNAARVRVGEVTGLEQVDLVLTPDGTIDEGSTVIPPQRDAAGPASSAGSRWPEGTTIAVLQGTSGTTGRPRVVPVTGEMVAANHRAIDARLALDAERVVSWLPLFHDMGLFGLFGLAARHSWPLSLSDSFTFSRDPASWFTACTAFDATLTAGPPLALEMARLHERHVTPDLSTLRHLVVGADRLDGSTLTRFHEWASSRGLASGALKTAYGMAEATLAVSIGPFDPSRIRNGVCSSGRPLEGVDVRTRPHEGGDVLEVSGPSVASHVLHDGHPVEVGTWLDTSDLGEVDRSSGELWIHQRHDDLVIIGGRNIDPAWVEDHLTSRFSGQIREVGVSSVDRGGSRRLLVVCRPGPGPYPTELDSQAVADHVYALTDVVPVVVQADGRLPRTSSGKLRRSALREVASDPAT